MRLEKQVWRGAASRAREAEVYGAGVLPSIPQLGVRDAGGGGAGVAGEGPPGSRPGCG